MCSGLRSGDGRRHLRRPDDRDLRDLRVRREGGGAPVSADQRHRSGGRHRPGDLHGRGPAVPGAFLMSTTAAGIIFIASLIVALGLVHRPLGDYMYRVYTGTKHTCVERGIYRLLGVSPDAEQRWSVYARSVLAFSVVSFLFLYGLQRLQDQLLLCLGMPPVSRPRRLEHRGQLRHQHQLAGVLRRVHDGPPGADGRPGGAELRVRRGRHGRRDRAGPRVRPQARPSELGNFWVDLVRGIAPHPAADRVRRRARPGRRRA